MENDSQVIKVALANKTTAFFETTQLQGEEKVFAGVAEFRDVLDAIEGVSESVLNAVKKVKPSKASVEFGVEVGMEAGKLTALIVKGNGKANLKINLEWASSPG